MNSTRVAIGECCVLCGRRMYGPGHGRYPICLDCHLPIRKSLIQSAAAGEQRCQVCSIPLVSEIDLCTRCRDMSYHFASNRSLFRYEGKAREIIHRYKFQGRKSLARLLAVLLAETYREHYDSVPIVPVPFRPSSRRRRGWDHVEVIANSLAAATGAEVLRVLRRRDGTAQKALSYAGRHRNLRGRVRLRYCWSRRALPPAVVLLDDVFTTGATADECSRVLLDGGVDSIYVLTVALD